MSLSNEMKRQSVNLLRIMQAAAKKGNCTNNGAFYGTQKVQGYVCRIHDGSDPNDDENLLGTIDVQEYMSDFDDAAAGEGYHEGVLLTAIQETKNADCLIIPALFSPVVITQDPVTLDEYVINYDFAAKINMVSAEAAQYGVSKRKELGDEVDGTFEEEAKKTGESSVTEYDGTSIKGIVSDGQNTSEHTQTVSRHEMKVGGVTFLVADNNIELGGGNYHAVLYEKLQSFLSELIQYLSTATAAGAPLSTAANIAALNAKLSTLSSQIVKIKG